MNEDADVDPELAQIRRRKIMELQRRLSSPGPSARAPPQGVVHLDGESFDSVISRGVVLVDFYADWCGPCKMMAPVVERLASEFAGRATIAKVDVDANPHLAARFQVMGIPTFALFKDGRLLRRIVGAVGYQALKAAISQAL